MISFNLKPARVSHPEGGSEAGQAVSQSNRESPNVDGGADGAEPCPKLLRRGRKTVDPVKPEESQAGWFG
jgi:hypothetical protein